MEERIVEVNKIRPYIHRERDKKILAALMESIKQHGLFVPVSITEEPDGSYTLVKGEGRCEAHKRLGLDQIKAFVYKEGELTEEDKTIHWLIENRVREKLPPQDKARLMSLEKAQGATVEKIAPRYGLKPATAKQYVDAFERASPKIKAMVEEGKIGFTHQKEIVSLVKDKETQEVVAQIAAEERLRLEDTRAVARKAREIKRRIGERPVSIQEVREELRGIRSETRKLKEILNKTVRRKEELLSAIRKLQQDTNFLHLLAKGGIPAYEEV